jgi:hypothetical protein
MDFSITTLFVVPVSNTLPTSGSTESLAAGQFGIYKDKARTCATSGNIGTAKFIQIAQGRPGTGMGTKLSDFIKASKVKRWEKFVGHEQAADEIWEISDLSATKGEDVVFTFRLHSNLLDARYSNGLTRSLVVPGACIACGDDPCETVANEDIIDAFFEQLTLQEAQQADAANGVKLSSYLVFEKIGTGSSAVIRITGKPVESIPVYAPDIASRNVDKDRMWFRPFVYKAPETTADFISPDLCDSVGTTTLIQKSSFVTGTSEEVKQMEVDFYSYQAKVKNLYRQGQYNGQFQSYVTDGTTYDLYFLQFDEMVGDSDVFAPHYAIDETVVLAIPQGESSTIETILEAYLGDVTDKSGTEQTTTTTTSTSSTTTTSTTILYP